MERFRHEFWQHAETGDVYAVKLDTDGTVVGASGPLYYNQRDLAALPYDDDARAEQLNAERGQYVVPSDLSTTVHRRGSCRSSLGRNVLPRWATPGETRLAAAVSGGGRAAAAPLRA